MSLGPGAVPPAGPADPDRPSAGGPTGARTPWGRFYALVLAALALDILLLWWLTERYR